MRRSTGEIGMVGRVQGDFLSVFFRDRPVQVHCSDLDPAPAEPLDQFLAGTIHDTTAFALRLRAQYLLHAYRYDPLAGLTNARIEPQLHQVFVAHRVMQKYRPRMILADEVGLGKTIEAGLVIKELLAREAVQRILIVCPASLQRQWQYEMAAKFNEKFEILDGHGLKFLGRDGSNPWTRVDRVITSLTLVSRAGRIEEVSDAPWDLVVFDEAHRVRRRYSPGRIEATRAYELADELKEYVDGMLLLTATPMQLHPFELYSLIELVEPGLFPSYEAYDLRRSQMPALNDVMRTLLEWDTFVDEELWLRLMRQRDLVLELGYSPDQAMAELDDMAEREAAIDALTRKHPLTLSMVRNRKAELGMSGQREATLIPVELSGTELQLYEDITEYIRNVYSRAIVNKNNAVGFLMVLYQNLLTSSSYALYDSFTKRRTKLEELLRLLGETEVSTRPVSNLGELREGEEYSEALDQLEDSVIDRELVEWEIEVLDGLLQRLSRNRDSKAVALVHDIVSPILADDEDEKILIFTGFLKTQELLAQALRTEGHRVAVFNGRMNLDQKEAAVRDFRTRAQIMISTEAGGEGRNFQFARNLVNYDLPWNPMRVEQRIGRLDRIGQKRPVRIYNLAAVGTVEERIVDVLDRRINLFEESVGSLDPILGEVERDLTRLILTQIENRDEELDQYGEELESRVKQARLTEELLADFILDRASLRKDTALELLEANPLARWEDLRTFVGDALTYLGGSLTAHNEGGDSIALSNNLASDLGARSAVTRGVFDPEAALEYEDLHFLAFGNELIDGIVRHAGELGAVTGAYVDPRLPPGAQEIEIYYELEWAGVRAGGRVVAHRIGERLEPAQRVVDRVPELGPAAVSELPEWAHAAIEASRTEMQHEQDRAREEANVENEASKEDAIARLERIHHYQRNRLRREIDNRRALIRERERSEGERERRILPAWRGRLRKGEERLRNLDSQTTRRKEEILATTADATSRVLAVALVTGP